MTNGELLYKLLEARGWQPLFCTGLPWGAIAPSVQQTFELVAQEFLHNAAPSFAPGTANLIPPSPYNFIPQSPVAQSPVAAVQRNWKPELQKYGRHLPTCIVGALCVCGFAEVEKELNP